MMRSLATRWVLTALVLSLALAISADARDSGHSQTRPAVEWRWFHNMSVADVNDQISQGFRPIDLEVERASPFRFSGAFVANQGAYQRAFWWYRGPLDVIQDREVQHDARYIDLERYQAGQQTGYLAIMVPRQSDWLYYLQSSLPSIVDTATSQNARVIDIESRTSGGQSTFDAVMADNTGGNNRSWWLYAGLTASEINRRAQQNQARLVDVEVGPNNTFSVVMEQPEGPNEAGGAWWYYGLTEAEVTQRADQHAARVTDIETYRVNGQKRFAVILLQNGG